jgi:hypothetical protein
VVRLGPFSQRKYRPGAAEILEREAMQRRRGSGAVDINAIMGRVLGKQSVPKTARSVTLTFYEDPGHGWLRVPIKLIHELDIAGQISRYSMIKKDMAYLEEDMDAGSFLRAAEAAGIHVNVRNKHTDNPSFIRRLTPWILGTDSDAFIYGT